MRTLFLAVFLSLAVGLAAGAAAGEDPLVVFDGAKSAAGSGWANPDDSASFKPVDLEGGRKALEFKAAWKNYWAGGGWNWTNWQGPGVDVTPYGALVVTLRRVEGEKLADVWVQLSDADKKVSPEVKLVGAGKIKALTPEFAEAAIPLAELGGGADFRKVCMLNIGLVPDGVATGSATVQIAGIRFVPAPPPKAE